MFLFRSKSLPIIILLAAFCILLLLQRQQHQEISELNHELAEVRSFLDNLDQKVYSISLANEFFEGFEDNKIDKDSLFARSFKKSTFPQLRVFWLESKDHMIRAGAVGILAKVRDEGSRETILKSLKDPEREVKHAAVLGVHRLRIDQALPDLIRLYKEGKTLFSPEILKMMLDDSDPRVGSRHRKNFLTKARTKSLRPLQKKSWILLK